MLVTYFDGFLMRFTTKEYTTINNKIEVGIVMFGVTRTFCSSSAAASKSKREQR